MRDVAWPRHCRKLLQDSVASAARQFPVRGEQAPERVHGVRKTLKAARAVARLFLPSLGEPARVTVTALAVVRRAERSIRRGECIARHARRGLHVLSTFAAERATLAPRKAR